MFNFGPQVPQITVDEVKKSLDQKMDVLLLDVRTREEYSSAKIRRSINIPADEIEEKILTLIPDKNQRIYTFCRSGLRSTFATIAMKKLGYTNVYNVTNGLLAWRTKNYPLES